MTNATYTVTVSTELIASLSQPTAALYVRQIDAEIEAGRCKDFPLDLYHALTKRSQKPRRKTKKAQVK